MKKKLLLATVFALSGSLLKAADQVSKENPGNVAQQSQQAASPLRDVTQFILNQMNIQSQQSLQRPTTSYAGGLRDDPNSTVAIFEREVVILGIRY